MDGDDGLLLNLSSSGDGQEESAQANKNKKLKWRERKLQKRNNRLALRVRRDERNSMTSKPFHNQRKESRTEPREESRKESREESRKESRTGAPPVEPEEGALRKEYGLSSAQKSTHVTKQPRKKAQVISSLFNYNPEIPALTKVSGELPNQKEETEEKLFSGDKFSELDLSPFMLSNLEENLKFTSMTSVQRAAIPPLLSGRDVFVKSKTGTGKTLTYAVPVVQSLQKLEPKITRGDGPYAVVLVPTRELAQQSFDVLLKLVKPFQWVVPGIVTGGEKRKSEKARIRKGINILVATPGRLLDHIEKTKSLELKRMRWIILDEADRLFDLGFEKDVSSILTAIQKSLTTGMRCQTALLSATLSEGVERLAGVSLNKPLFIDVTDNEGAAKTTDSPQAAADTSYKTPQELQQYFIIVPNKLRLVTLAVFLLWKNRTEDSTAAKMIVFLSSRDSVDFHCDLLKETLPSRSKFQLTLFKLHGNMSQTERTDVFKRFTEAKCGILFCTDVAARGLDLPHVNWIIQYNTPGNPADYVHRVGRTARIGSKGQALLFLTPAEVEYLETLKQHGIGSPKEIFVNEVLRTLVDFPKDVNNKKHKNLLDQRAQEEATNLQNSFEDYVLSEPRHLEAAKTAYQSFVRAYATYPSSLKHIFHIKNLHLGHVAKSFALREAPAEMFQPTKQHKTGKRKREDHKNKNQNKTKVKRVTEYSSDTGLNGPLPKQKKKGVAAKKRKKT